MLIKVGAKPTDLAQICNVAICKTFFENYRIIYCLMIFAKFLRYERWKVCKTCRSKQILQNDTQELSKVGLDTAKSEPSELSYR